MSPPRFEYEIPITTQIEPGDTVWFRSGGALGVGDVVRSPCLEMGYNGFARNSAYAIEIRGGLTVWSNEVTKAVRPYAPGAWIAA